MPDLEMCPHCSIALVDCEYHGPKAKGLREVTSSDTTYETVDRILAANGLHVDGAGDLLSMPACDISSAEYAAPEPKPDTSGCSCWKTWKIHEGPDGAIAKERIIERGNPDCAVHGAPGCQYCEKPRAAIGYFRGNRSQPVSLCGDHAEMHKADFPSMVPPPEKVAETERAIRRAVEGR